VRSPPAPQAELEEERLRCLSVLGSNKEPALATRTLELALSAAVRSQDVATPFHGTAATNPALVWDFFKNRAQELHARFGNTFLWSGIVGAVTTHFASAARADEIESLFAKIGGAGNAARVLQQALEGMRGRAVRVAREAPLVAAYMAAAAAAGSR
jgi:hypothetical protein